MLLVALFGIPVLFKWMDRDAAIAARHFYAVWWLVGLLPVLLEVQRWAAARDDVPAAPAGRPVPRPRLGACTSATAFCSLLAHMAMMHWVYRVRFWPADAGAAAAGAGGRAQARGAEPRHPARRPAAAPLATARGGGGGVFLGAARTWAFGLGRGGRVAVTPPMLAGVGAYLAYVYLYLLPLAIWFLAAGATAVLLVLLGPTFTEIWATACTGWRWSTEMTLRVMPKTAVQWGITAVGAAFGFLGLGAAVSLTQEKQPPPELTPPKGQD